MAGGGEFCSGELARLRGQAELHRDANQPRGGAHIELVHDLCAVVLDGLCLDPEAFGDVLASVTFSDQLQDLSLPRRERISIVLLTSQITLQDKVRDARV